MLREVTHAEHLGGHRVYLVFDDGEEGSIDLARLISFRGVFTALRDPDEVAKVRVDPELGTITWPGGADLDPLVLYSAATGRPLELRRPVAVGGRA